jgi:hypothetical protein
MKCRVLVYQYIFETDEQDVPRGLCQDTSGHRDCEDGSGQDNVHGEDDPTRLGIGRSLKFKSLVSSRSALSRSLQGSTGPLIDHKSWRSPDLYGTAIRCAISIVPPEFMYSVTPVARKL